MDIYNMSGFKWWCKQRRNSSFIVVTFLAFFCVVFFKGIASNSEIKNNLTSGVADKGAIAVATILGLMFLFMVLSALRSTIRSINVKVDEYWYGTITDSYIRRSGSSRNRKRRHYIVADVDGKEMDARCMIQTYRKAEKGQQIVVFKVKGEKRLYCVHPEM